MQDWAGCAPLAWGTQPVPDLRQCLGRHAAAETHAARRAGDTGGPSCPRPASVFLRVALPKEPVGSRSFPHPHAPRKIGSAVLVCLPWPRPRRVITAAARPGAVGPFAPQPGSPAVPAPPCHPQGGWGVPLPLSIPGHQSQGTPALCSGRQGSVERHRQLSLGYPHEATGTRQV